MRTHSQIAHDMHELFTKEEYRDCGDYSVEKIKREFWGLVVRDYIPIFLSVYEILEERGNIGNSNRYVYGDIDVGVWIEPTNKKGRKVIASTRYCAMADDNTHIYILDDPHEDYPEFIKFVCKTAWPREKKKKKSWANFGDHRDIEIPSLETYRRFNFDFGYGDGRDKGYSFAYSTFPTPNIDTPWYDVNIGVALRFLKWHLEALKNYEENRCL